MTTENNANTTTERKAPPILRAGTDRSGKVIGVTLWVNESAGEEGSKAPQMTGLLINGDQKTPVSVWVHEGTNGNFVSMSERNVKNADGSWSNKKLGKGNAVNTERDNNGVQQPLAENKIPYMLFNVGEQTYRANCAPGALDFMADLGFKPEVIDNYERKIKADASRSAAPKP